MTTSKPSKKGPNRQQIVEQMRREHVDRELFTLDYLNQTMNYIMYNNQSLTSYLEIDTGLLDRVITEDVKKVGLHFVQRIKSMKQTCDQNIFLKDLQQYGDFVNYDLPKTYQRDLQFIQSQLRHEIQTEMTTKRLKKRFPSIENRMTSNEVYKLNRKTKEETLNSLINNWQMIPEINQNNLQRNGLYRDLFSLENVIRNQSEDGMIIQSIPLQQGISNKIKIAQKPEVKNQIADPNKSKKIVKGAKKHQSSNQQPEEYVPKITKKLKIDQNPMIIPKPVLNNPQTLEAKTIKQPQPASQPNPVLLGQMAEIDRKSTKNSNNVNSSDGIKINLGSENELKKEKLSDQQNVVSNTNPQQRVKRKYNKTPKQQKGDDSKKSKKIQKEQKEKWQYHRKQKKQEEQQASKKKKEKKPQSNQLKKSELQAQSVQTAGLTNTPLQKNEKIKYVSYVSIAIQTHQKQEKSESKIQIKQQKLVQNISISIHPQKEKINIFQSIRIQDLKQQKHQINPNNSLIGQGSILSESQSLQVICNIFKQSIISRQDNVLQSELEVSNPFYTENQVRNAQQQDNAQQNQIQESKQLDIGDFLN